VRWLRRHALVIGVALFGLASFAAFSWSEYGYFCDQGRDHGNKGCESFWSSAHLHDWIYNTTSNWQSECLIGILLLVLLLKVEGARGADRDDT
jgi:hypothetical protein